MARVDWGRNAHAPDHGPRDRARASRSRRRVGADAHSDGDAVTTATATPTATARRRRPRRSASADQGGPAVYDDYSRDGVIDVCDHTQDTLQKTLDSIEPSFDQDYPDFRAALQAGIDKSQGRRLPGRLELQRLEPTADADAPRRSGRGPAAGSTAPTPTPTPESGQLPRRAPASGAGAATPAEHGDGAAAPRISPGADRHRRPPRPRSRRSRSHVPPAATPIATPVVVHGGHRSLLIPLLLIGARAARRARPLALSASPRAAQPRRITHGAKPRSAPAAPGPISATGCGSAAERLPESGKNPLVR